jgi:hypothetical protein
VRPNEYFSRLHNVSLLQILPFVVALTVFAAAAEEMDTVAAADLFTEKELEDIESVLPLPEAMKLVFLERTISSIVTKFDILVETP